MVQWCHCVKCEVSSVKWWMFDVMALWFNDVIVSSVKCEVMDLSCNGLLWLLDVIVWSHCFMWWMFDVMDVSCYAFFAYKVRLFVGNVSTCVLKTFSVSCYLYAYLCLCVCVCIYIYIYIYSVLCMLLPVCCSLTGPGIQPFVPNTQQQTNKQTNRQTIKRNTTKTKTCY